MEDLFPLEPSWILIGVAAVIAFFMLKRLAWALHWQNVLLIAAGVMIAEGLLQLWVDRLARTDVPEPKWRYMTGSVLLWLAVVLTARRTAKFIARPWRHEKVHWLWVILLSAIGVGAFQFGWTMANPDFIFPQRVYGIAGARAGGTAVVLACLAPWFIRKNAIPGKDFSELPDDPEDEAEEQAQKQAGDHGEVKTGIAASDMNIAGQPTQPPTPKA